MNRIVPIRRFFPKSVNEREDSNSLDIDASVLDELVELVGSEKKVEKAAEAAYRDLLDAFEKGEVEVTDQEVPENLAVASLVLKLIDMGEIEPQEADDFISKHVG